MSSPRKGWSLLKTDPALMMGLACSVAYYSVMLQPAMRETQLAKYTCEHSVEFVIVTLFFWGIIDIMLKLMTFPREYFAACHDWLPPRKGREPASRARELLEGIQKKPAWLLHSAVGRRLIEGLSFVAEKNSADEYRDHLQHLADLDDQALHSKYTVLRFVIAVTPILGFLGTVVHFGAAIGSFSFDNMDAKLPEIVAGMGTAFNTTSVALATAMTMMFAMFLCERVDQSIVATIDRLVDRELLHRFEAKDPNIVPFLSILQTANREVLDSIARTLQEQVAVWNRGLDTLFEHFQERQRLELARGQEGFEILRQRHDSFEVARDDQLKQSLSMIDARQEKHLLQIESALDRATQFREEVAHLLQTLDTIASGEGRLADLQATLTDNLRAIHESSQIDSALHQLTAAIHLITSRSRPHNFPDSAAA